VFVWGVVALVLASAVIFSRSLQAGWDVPRQPREALAAKLVEMGVPVDDRIMSIDAGGIKYWTGHPGVVSPDDPIETIEAVARAYDIRWLVLERDDAARALAPVLQGLARPLWIGAPVFEVKPPTEATPRLALYPVCFASDDDRCDGPLFTP
jgi:hypothetical protein